MVMEGLILFWNLWIFSSISSLPHTHTFCILWPDAPGKMIQFSEVRTDLGAEIRVRIPALYCYGPTVGFASWFLYLKYLTH